MLDISMSYLSLVALVAAALTEIHCMVQVVVVEAEKYALSTEYQ
jgi:hypothetical protein